MEFALCLPLLLIMTIGSFVIGMMFDRYLTVIQLVRNAGSMYARGIDFANDRNKGALLRSASGLRMKVDGGAGVVYLSTVMMVPAGAGDNENMPVVTQRYVIGNPSIHASPLGEPPVGKAGNVPNFLNDRAAVAALPPDIAAAMRPDERLFVAEVYHRPIDLNYSPLQAVDLLYSRSYF